MVSVSEASAIVQSHPFAPGTKNIAITKACGKVLGEPIVADRDLPPFNRVAMDGIAIQHAQFSKGNRSFSIEGVAAAGQPQQQLRNTAHCYEVMTGAPLPKNTDTVVRYEDLMITQNEAKIMVDNLSIGQNIHVQGADARKDNVLLLPGKIISPAEINIIASVGKSTIKIRTLPHAAILSTGDELVDIKEQPKPHQIRRSNNYAMHAALQTMGCRATLYHLFDRKEEIKKTLSGIIAQHELLILSGGVSQGKFDFIPAALEELGVVKHFHKVKQKPGKPFWFGTLGSKTVFALPGNPVSTYICFYKYIRPWLWKSLGVEYQENLALLAHDFEFLPDFTYFVEVQVVNQQGKLLAYPQVGRGSGDFANLKNTNGFLELPDGRNHFKAGEFFPIHWFRND